jgi:hypothetical protein
MRANFYRLPDDKEPFFWCIPENVKEAKQYLHMYYGYTLDVDYKIIYEQ